MTANANMMPKGALQGPPSKGLIHVVSCSTGKDSVATLLVAVKRFGAHRVRGSATPAMSTNSSGSTVSTWNAPPAFRSSS